MQFRSPYLALLSLLIPPAIAQANPGDFLEPRAPAVTAAPDPCSLVGELVSICSLKTADNPTAQAGCMCYDGTTYIGNALDSEIASCVTELNAGGDKSDAVVMESLSGFCGNYAGSGSPVTLTSATNPALSSQSKVTAVACSTVLFYLSYCESVSPGFTDLNPITQAPCLCYSSAVWQPTSFDNAVSSCASSLAGLGDQSEASSINSLADFCSSVGDVGNPLTVSASTTGQASSTTASAGGSNSAGVISISGATPGGATTSSTTPSATAVLKIGGAASQLSQPNTFLALIGAGIGLVLGL